MTIHDYHLTASGCLVIDTAAVEITIHPADLCAAIVAAGFADDYNDEYELLFECENSYTTRFLWAWYEEYAGTTDFNFVLDKILKP